MEEKSKQIFGQNECGKFENKTCSSPPAVDIEELKRENRLLKEKLLAIQSESEGCGSSKPPKAESKPKAVSVSSEDLSCKGNTKLSARGRSNSCKIRKSDNYWYSCAGPALPCRYNPRCYSKNVLHNDVCDCQDDGYLSDMYYRYPDYFPRDGRGGRDVRDGLGYWPNERLRRQASYEDVNRLLRTRSYEDVNRVLEMNALYNRTPVRRWRPRTKSVEVVSPPPSAVAQARVRRQSCEDPGMPLRWTDDPYYVERWKCNVPRIPFRPRSVWDVCIGMKISMHRSDGRLSRGIVRWIGLLPNLAGEYVGVELETQTGRHDGYLNGVRYFKCRDNCGIFVKFTKIIMAWR